MQLVIGYVTHGDFDSVADLCPDVAGTRSRRKEEWDELWTAGNPFGVLVRDLNADRSQQDVAVLLGAYVQDHVIDDIVKVGTPNANRRILALRNSKRNPFVSPTDVGFANSGLGLNLVFTHLGWRENSSVEGSPTLLRGAACNGFLDRLSGNRHKTVLAFAQTAEHSRIYRKIGFEPLKITSGESRVDWFGISRDAALDHENPWMTRLFSYNPPRFRFTENQRQILLLAREGLTDNEIAETVGSRADAIKKRWAGIYDRVNDVLPTLLPPSTSSGRGSEKRRALLAHLRDRPEELRPFSRVTGTSGRR
ncbi:hypothetical protein BH11ARM1_BH11ARM1_08190 [soil metagenome]